MLHTKVSVVAAKIETTVGTAESLAAADADYIVYGFRINPDIPFQERPGQGSMSRHAGVPGARGGSVTFSIDLTPGSTTTPPQWASAFLPACGWVATAGVFSPQTNPPGSGGVKTLTIAHYQMGRKKVLAGAMGTFRIVATAGQKVMIEFTFTGVWQAPADVTILSSITYPSDSPLRFAAASAFTFHSYAAKVQQVTVDCGNVVRLREDANNATGYISAVIEDRAVTGTLNPEAVLVGTKDWHAIWVARTEAAMDLTLGDGTNTVSLDAPKAQITNVQESDRNGLFVEDITFACNRSAAAGDDELTITFA